MKKSKAKNPANSQRRKGRKTISKTKKIKFYPALEMFSARRGAALENLYDSEDHVSKRVLEEYGAIFAANETVVAPPVCIFASREAVTDFQARIKIGAAEISGVRIELQQAALEALLTARAEAQEKGLDITPRGGAEAARRSYDDTVRLWESRFLPALEYWQKAGRIRPAEAENLRTLKLREQIAAVLKLEEQGIFFSKDFSKSILYSVAAPGASQHLSLLAFDASEFADPKVRRVLARRGWFRTVKSDLPHFTFLGLPEMQLPPRGLKKVKTADGEFWIPNV